MVIVRRIHMSDFVFHVDVAYCDNILHHDKVLGTVGNFYITFF